MTSQTLQLVTDSHSPTLNNSMFINSPPSGNGGYNIMHHLLSKYRAFTQDIQDIIDIIDSEPDNTSLTKMQWDATYSIIGEAEINAFLLINETHATSKEIRDRITAGISRQLRLAAEDGDTELAVSESSKASLFNFAKMQKITTAPFIVLRDNGNLSAIWKFNDKDKFKLIFLKDGSLNYVAFLNKAGERDIQHENTDITGVMEFIQSNGIPL